MGTRAPINISPLGSTKTYLLSGAVLRGACRRLGVARKRRCQPVIVGPWPSQEYAPGGQRRNATMSARIETRCLALRKAFVCRMARAG